MYALQYDEAGNWLDSPILVESVGTQEGPDFATDTDAYQEMLLSLEGICQYRDTLASLKGISQHYALEAYELIPNWEQTVPRSYYSQHVSQVQYVYTQENLAKAFWDTIKRIWAHLKRMIRKAFYRIIGRPDPQDTVAAAPGNNEASVSEAEAAEGVRQAKIIEVGIRKKKAVNDTFAHTVASLQRVVKERGFIMDLGGEKRSFHSLNELLDAVFSQPEAPDLYKSFYFTTDPLWRDMVTNGPYTQYLLQVVKQLPAIITSLTGQMYFLDKTIENVNGPDRAAVLPVLHNLAHGERKVAVAGVTQSLAEIQNQLQKIRHDWVIDQHVAGEERDDYTLFSQRTMYFWSTHAIESLVESQILILPDVAKLSSGVDGIAQLFDEARPLLDESHTGHQLRQALEYVANEASAAMRILVDVKSYLNSHQMMVERSHAMVGYFVRIAHPYFFKYGNDATTDSVGSVMNSLQVIMKELKD
jgi:hypothetical protein